MPNLLNYVCKPEKILAFRRFTSIAGILNSADLCLSQFEMQFFLSAEYQYIIILFQQIYELWDLTDRARLFDEGDYLHRYHTTGA